MAERWRMCAWKIESRVGHHTAPTQRNARHSERAQLSGLDMRERGRDSAEHNLHLTSHQIGRRGSRAAVRGWLLASGGRAPRTNGPPDALSRAAALCAASVRFGRKVEGGRFESLFSCHAIILPAATAPLALRSTV